MHNPGEIRPQLAHDAVILPTGQGVLCKRENAAFRLTGKSIARWLSALGPYMTGEYTLEKLCDGLEPAQRETVTRLVETLLQRGILTSPQPEAPDLLPEEVRATFRAQIEFINHFTDRPQERFRAFRESRILVIGSGAAFTSLALTLVRNGLKKLFLVPGEERQEVLHTLEPEIERLGNEGCEIFLSTVDLTSQSSASNFRNYDVVVYCSENESLEEVFALNRRCISEERPFLPAVTFARRALIGPFVRSSSGPCWLCAQMRLAANMSEGQSAALWRTMLLGEEQGGQGRATALSAPAARRIGHGSGFELFKLLSGVLPSETEGGVIFQELDNLETSHSTLLQHPLCPHCSQPVRLNNSTIEQLQEIVAQKRDSHVARDELLQRFSPLIDSRSGLFSGFSDEDMLQLPLKGTQLVMNSPTSGRRSEVLAYSLESVLAARVLALKRAVSRYAQELAGTQHTLFASYNELEQRGKAAIAPSDLRTWSGTYAAGPHTRLTWLPAFSLLKQAPYYVPAAAAYPFSQLNHLELFAKTSAGQAAETTFRDVLTAGLRTALTYQVLQELARGAAALRAIEPEALSSGNADLTLLLRSAQSFARPFTLREVRHSWPISVALAFTTDEEAEQILSVGGGLSSGEAVREALLDFSGKLQYLAYAGRLPRTEDEPFPHLSSIVAHTPVQEGTGFLEKPERTLEQIEDSLRTHGEEILFVNTTPPDIWETRTVFAGTILLASHAQEEGGEPDVRTEPEGPGGL